MYKSAIHNCFFGVCCVCAIAITLIGTGLRASAQTTSAELSFKVATIKPSRPFDPKHFWVHVSPARASYWSMTLRLLISYAYDVELFQVTGPEWTNGDSFDIEARFPEGAVKENDRRMMLQTLLKDRFNLLFHLEKRALQGYVLVVAKHGAKLTPSVADTAKPDSDGPLQPGESSDGEGQAKSAITQNHDGSSTSDMGKRGTLTTKFDQEDSAMQIERSKMTMEELAGGLSGCLGGGMYKVEDQTGLKGNYQVTYDCPLELHRTSDPQDGSSLTKSLDALGLKLERRKTPTVVYVIDHAERPSEN